jgi:molybdopterin-containing oxidoreductase family iron-sulfur binding subunit
MSEQPIDRYRRRLLGGAVAAGTLTLAPGVFLHRIAEAKTDAEPVTSIVRWGLLVDTGKCSDCTACVDACREEHGWHGHDRPRSDAQWIRKVELRDRSTGRRVSLPMMCQHCAEPPCVDVCPTGASFKRADGIVLVDKHICIGCRYCMMACPYKARSFVHEDLTDQKPHSPRGKGTVESCTNDPRSAIHQALATFPSTQVRADLGLDLGVRYRGL